ncbi:SDR family oxidoreductase [Egicoccus halophilus]|uniref:Oxidoreductase n=1 Tax=Egicoccus halophilus TaxID=1670830 RepID=A0A8J3A6Q1_9ACTN|nr:SDR family oxidoreductase [Egicoccus halophilus]GGI04585.1 oxidoreductase [Egicoccus halophilus]
MSRTAIVTGASSGIGKATAVVLARAGYDVGLTYAGNEDGARGTAGEIETIGQRAVVRRLDLTDPLASPKVVEELIEELGHLDVLVNNAGEGSETPFLDQGLDEWRQVLDVDLTGAFLVMQTAARSMVRRGEGGRIVAVTSVHEHVPLRGSSAYCAAKGGLGLLLKVMALELGEHGVTVNAVAPGEIATKMTDQHDDDPRTTSRPGLAVRRPGDAFEIAHAVAYLASPQAAYTTGTSLNVDGGLLLMGAEANRRLAE